MSRNHFHKEELDHHRFQLINNPCMKYTTCNLTPNCCCTANQPLWGAAIDIIVFYSYRHKYITKELLLFCIIPLLFSPFVICVCVCVWSQLIEIKRSSASCMQKSENFQIDWPITTITWIKNNLSLQIEFEQFFATV